MNNIPAYQTELLKTENRKIQYLFESCGVTDVIKAIEYTPIAKRKGKTVYNLGFGDYNAYTGSIFDNTDTNNGDMRKVFSTVLNTIPKFFRENKNAAIWVQGSDSEEEYKVICKETCRKKCLDVCKNFNRRIKTYRYYIEKNFATLCSQYLFFGILDKKTGEIVQYIPGKEYFAILVFKKK